jgi:hypothetical protein
MQCSVMHIIALLLFQVQKGLLLAAGVPCLIVASGVVLYEHPFLACGVVRICEAACNTACILPAPWFTFAHQGVPHHAPSRCRALLCVLFVHRWCIYTLCTHVLCVNPCPTV